MPIRLYLPAPLAAGAELALPAEASRHLQVLRLQPGDPFILFNGEGGQWQAEVVRMGRQVVEVRVGAADAVERELPRQVSLALGMPANERMDALVEKATELGAALIQPLHSARSVLKLSGERAERRQAHWQAVAVAASEQSGRTRVPEVAAVRTLAAWLAALPPVADGEARGLLSFADDARTLQQGWPLAATRWRVLSGPEGGLDAQEEALARAHGFVPLSLGPRVLRADTAPLAVLTLLGQLGGG